MRAGEPVFMPGTIFTNVLLADEINRTPPRTQSALLEAMQERNVTVEGRVHRLPGPVPRDRDAEPVRAGGRLPAPGVAARPVPLQDRARLLRRRARGRDAPPPPHRRHPGHARRDHAAARDRRAGQGPAGARRDGDVAGDRAGTSSASSARPASSTASSSAPARAPRSTSRARARRAPASRAATRSRWTTSATSRRTCSDTVSSAPATRRLTGPWPRRSSTRSCSSPTAAASPGASARTRAGRRRVLRDRVEAGVGSRHGDSRDRGVGAPAARVGRAGRAAPGGPHGRRLRRLAEAGLGHGLAGRGGRDGDRRRGRRRRRLARATREWPRSRRGRATAARGKGVGSALYRALAEWALERGCIELQTVVDEDDPESLRWAERHGFRETGRNTRLVLDLDGVTPPAIDPPAGITVAPWASLPGIEAGLYRVYCEAEPDIPGEGGNVLPSLEEWLADDMDGASDRRDAVFVALAGAEVVGYAKLSIPPEGSDTAFHDLAGVRREWRRRGIAGALKRAQIAWAKEQWIPTSRDGQRGAQRPDQTPQREARLPRRAGPHRAPHDARRLRVAERDPRPTGDPKPQPGPGQGARLKPRPCPRHRHRPRSRSL